MPQFRDEHIVIIAPGSKTTLAQLGLPESFTPARLRVKTRMFPGEKPGEWEPNKVKRIEKNAIHDRKSAVSAKSVEDEDPLYEEDPFSDEGGVWPIQSGRITNWSCLFALMTHIYNTLSPPFHTPILLVTEPAWTAREHEKLAQFFFEKFKPPGLALMDSAHATCYAFGTTTACVVDVGLSKADITAVTDCTVNDVGRGISIEECGGEAMTDQLLRLLGRKGYSRDMCEQLKVSPICEVLPLGTPLPTSPPKEEGFVENPAAAASTGADGSGPNQRHTAGSLGEAPRGPGKDTEVAEEGQKGDEDENEGVLDVASIVTSGRMHEILSKKEKEKVEKTGPKKKGSEPNTIQAKSIKLKNSERETNTFLYEDRALLDALNESQAQNSNSFRQAVTTQQDLQDADGNAALHQTRQNGADTAQTTTSETHFSKPHNLTHPPRREITIGIERFQAVPESLVANLTDAIHRAILSVSNQSRRAELWDSLIFVGNGSAIRGFKEALLGTLQARFLVSPSSATIFTSELPSNLSTPLATGANTPVSHAQVHGHGAGVNPLLLAATTASAQTQMQYAANSHLHPSNTHTPSPAQVQSMHSSHGQTPTSIKVLKMPEYFPEWKEVGSDEAVFLGAQVAAKVLFIADTVGQGNGKGYMSRSDYNEQGPSGIHEYLM